MQILDHLIIHHNINNILVSALLCCGSRITRRLEGFLQMIMKQDVNLK